MSEDQQAIFMAKLAEFSAKFQNKFMEILGDQQASSGDNSQDLMSKMGLTDEFNDLLKTLGMNKEIKINTQTEYLQFEEKMKNKVKEMREDQQAIFMAKYAEFSAKFQNKFMEILMGDQQASSSGERGR